MNILVVEDEAKVLQYLLEVLRKDGHVVHGCETLEDAVSELEAHGRELDLLVMDRLMHGADAISLIPTCRANCAKTKILVLSTINTPAQKAAALDLGADDYLSKPFSLVELSARIRSLTRRTGDNLSASGFIYSAKDLQLNAIEHQVTCRGQPIDLSNKEYQLLMTLIRSPGRVFNRFQLLDKVWNAQADIESNVVEVTVKNLRRKLREAGSEAEILSRRNIGYWIEA